MHLPTGSGDHPPRLPEPLWGPTNSGVDSGFFAPGHLQGDTVMLSSTESWPTVCMQGTDQRRVYCKLGSSLQRQTIHNHFKSSCIRDRHIQVHVPHQHVGADSSSYLPAYPGSHTFQSEATPAQLPPVHKLHDDGHCQVDGHIGSCAQTGGELVGEVSAAPAPTPAWERTSACTCSGILVNKIARNLSSTLALASCCQPDRTVPGSKWSGSRSGGRVPAADASQLGANRNPMLPKTKRHGSSSDHVVPLLWRYGEFCTDTPTPRRHVSEKNAAAIWGSTTLAT